MSNIGYCIKPGCVYQAVDGSFCQFHLPPNVAEAPARELKKLDQDKVPLQLIPASLIFAVGTILGFGARKYAPRAWEQGFEWSRAFGATLRHLYAWWKGEAVDAETGKSHLWHAACEIAFLIEWEETHAGTDDRPGQKPDTVKRSDTLKLTYRTPGGLYAE